ncbi:unnamed protein product, partial [Discosporangium mesarthrocarpum]
GSYRDCSLNILSRSTRAVNARLLRGGAACSKTCLSSFAAGGGGNVPPSPTGPSATGNDTPGTVEDDAEILKRITLARVATKYFDGRPVPKDVLEQVLSLVSRAPSSFNIQPYVCVVITSDEAKKRVSWAMMGPNRQRVLEAGATVVFASDLNSFKNMGKLRELLLEEGRSPEYVRRMALYLSVFSSGHNRNSCCLPRLMGWRPAPWRGSTCDACARL